MLLLNFIIAFAISFPIVLLVISLFRAYREDGDPTKVNLFFLLLLSITLFFTSCSPEDSLDPPTCIGGECIAQFSVEGIIDENGYFHVNLDWDAEYYPRFNIEVQSNLTDPWWWYNEVPVIQANFYTGDNWQFQNDELPIVQSNRVYLKKIGDNKAYAKRIVGPIPPQFKNDTIYIEPDVFWDAGDHSTKIQYSAIKIILE